MKINDFASHITRLEAGKKQVDVAQVSEVLKLVNKELWGIPYLLIRFKGFWAELCLWSAVLVGFGVALAYAVALASPWRLHEEPVYQASYINDCGDNTPPVAVIEVTPGG